QKLVLHLPGPFGLAAGCPLSLEQYGALFFHRSSFGDIERYADQLIRRSMWAKIRPAACEDPMHRAVEPNIAILDFVFRAIRNTCRDGSLHPLNIIRVDRLPQF